MGWCCGCHWAQTKAPTAVFGFAINPNKMQWRCWLGRKKCACGKACSAPVCVTCLHPTSGDNTHLCGLSPPPTMVRATAEASALSISHWDGQLKTVPVLNLNRTSLSILATGLCFQVELSIFKTTMFLMLVRFENRQASQKIQVLHAKLSNCSFPTCKRMEGVVMSCQDIIVGS
jgi:hypothetical protein